MGSPPTWPALAARFAGRAEPIAFVVPVYNHARTVRDVVCAAVETGCQVWVVDDGSTDETSAALEGISGATIIRHNVNLGKGAAIMTGMRAASGSARWVVTADADGQHNIADAINLVLAAERFGGRALVLGAREGMRGPHVPWTSQFGRRFSDFWVRLSGGPRVQDTQSGFRLYPVPEVLQLGVKARRFQFEVEVLVLCARAGLPVIETPVSVIYDPPGGRVSHFRPWTDFWRNAATFTRLIFQRVTRTGATQGKEGEHAA